MQLVAVQMTLDVNDFLSRAAFRAKIESLMQKAVAQTDSSLPTLVAFPEDVGLMLVIQGLEKQLTAVTTISGAIERATRAFIFPLMWLRLRHRLSWVPALFLHRHKIVAETFFDVFSAMARKYGCHIVAGSVVLPPYHIKDGAVAWQEGPAEAHVYNSSYLFGPDGKVIGRQDKVHLIDLEQEAALDLTPGHVSRIRVFDTALGKVGIAICLDAFQDDVAAALLEGGATILVQPSANPGPWTEEQQIDWLRGSHQRVTQPDGFNYAINPMLNGALWDIAFYGQSSIVAKAMQGDRPLGYTDCEAMPEFIAVAESAVSEEILVAKVPREGHPTT